jgi:hypothetical protein
MVVSSVVVYTHVRGAILSFSSYLQFWVLGNKSESKNHWFWVFEKKNQNQRTISFDYFKTPQRITKFHEITHGFPTDYLKAMIIFHD